MTQDTERATRVQRTRDDIGWNDGPDIREMALALCDEVAGLAREVVELRAAIAKATEGSKS